MANDSLIRKIPLLGSCDLTNFHADIYDYEGFKKDNSLFINKRKVNWWKRYIGTGEIGGGVRGVVNGDYFDVYKEGTLIGKVSRQYYKLESVSSTAWDAETLNKVVNPYPESDNKAVFLKNKLLGKNDNICTVEKIGTYYFVADLSAEQNIKVYDSNLNLYDSFSISLTSDSTIDYIAFFHRDSGYDFSYQFTDTTWEHPTFSFNLPEGYVYIYLQHAKGGKFKEAYIYDIATKTRYYNSSSSYRWLTVSDNFANFDTSAFAQNSGAFGTRRKEIDYGYQYLYYDVFVVNNNIYFSIYNWFSGYSTNELKVFFNSGNTDTYSPGQNKSPAFNFKKESNQDNAGVKKWDLEFFLDTDVIGFTKVYTLPKEEYAKTIFNYSKKYGKWAINFINNKAANIAHEYKMLYELEGNETSGTVTDIDGYNDTYIYYHYGSNYYRISIQTATNFEDVVTSLNNVFFIFNTVSYLNAFYSAGNDWFCSCDDWNDRALWYINYDNWYEIQITSRLNNNWQTFPDVLSVSAQLAPNLKKVAVRPDTSTIQAYSAGMTWDGESIVYTSSGTKVNTDTWEYGHSLNGYYYALTYISVPDSITPFYVDTNYTCPQYLNQNLQDVKQRYDVFFSENPPRDSAEQSLIKQGYLSVDGFTVQKDSGNIFTIPDTVYEYQEIPALLDSVFNMSTISVIINRPSGSYVGMTAASLGGAWVLVYLNKTEVDPIKTGDAVFIINGVEYTYRAEPNRIVDYTGAYVCNTYLMQYIGYSTKCAFFYSIFDNAVYMFVGDNSMQKLIPLENYKPQFRVYSGVGQVDTLLISSLNVVIVNLDTAFLALFEDQYILIESGKINQWSIDESKGTIIVNGVMYSLIKSSLSYGNYLENEITPLPIEIETQFYGDTGSEKNLINDCVYLTVDNLMSLATGEVTVQAVALQNQKIIKAEEKKLKLKQSDFNELSQCLIKYQPKLQECRGFKLKIKSDFEIADLKIGTAQGAINQTTKRI